MIWLHPTDICVVTGGSGGLGAELLRAFALEGCQTVSIDVKAGAEEEEATKSVASKSVTTKEEATNEDCQVDSVQEEETETKTEVDLGPTLSIECDVRSASDLRRARDMIFERFKRYPSVLVLNAGIRRPLHSIAESEFEDLQDVIDVNLGGVAKCMHTFLPDMIANERGFIVSIASALGIVVPKGLGAYGASKAGIIGLHDALEQEVMGFKNIHAMLVCPGQLETPMFSDVKTPSETLAPIVPPANLAAKIVKRIRKAKTSVVYAPAYVRYLPLMHSIPAPLARFLRRVSGIDAVYDAAVKQRNEQLEAAMDADGNVGTSIRSVDDSHADGAVAEVPQPNCGTDDFSKPAAPENSISGAFSGDPGQRP